MIYVVIPTYNEAANIERLLYDVSALEFDDLRVLVVDDGSPDGTADIVRRVQTSRPSVELLQRQGKQGLGTAYKEGFQYALKHGAHFIFSLDADFSHDPKDIPLLLKEAQAGFHLVIGSRRISKGRIIGWPLHRRLMSNAATAAARLFLGLCTKDVTAGFRCYRRECFENVPLSSLQSQGYVFQEEILFYIEKARLQVKEIPVIFVDRAAGRSKLSRQDILEFFRILLHLRLKKENVEK